ncbi:translation initiation factor IF3-2, chloroplastic isoform X2 [Dendrobium catenatum]|uniref:translation initiation factor IF3-2, chloroplastic isoform X2 n=1 Tax=Dendrobium catenatum TaxID=906689 RepID=UPI00109F1186|nr:translation initiation factor IF3-2, chloroplastic isoform X2 [Dendrobium catenatum]
MAGVAGLCFTPPSKLTCVPAGCPLGKSLFKPPSRLRLCKVPRGGWLVARFGSGGYKPRPAGVPRRSSGKSRFVDSDYDQALDLDRIQSPSVRLLDEQQNMAILSSDADPPVLRLFESPDYKKHKYEQLKKKRVQMKRSAANRMDTKELKMGYNIDSHDYSVRLKAAQKFLKDGDKVKVIVNLKGRENEFKNIAIELIKRFQNDVGELATEESKSFSERNIYLILTPNKAALQKVQEQPKKETSAAAEVSASV